jgi:hypothetical protein
MVRSREFAEDWRAKRARLQCCSAWLLSVLLLSFCFNAKLPRYELQKNTNQWAAPQLSLGGEKIQPEPENSRPSIFAIGLILPNPTSIDLRALRRVTTAGIPHEFGPSDPDPFRRPPPEL